MLDLAFVRNNLGLVRERLATRQIDADSLLGGFELQDKLRRTAIADLERLQAARNARSADIAHKKRNGQNTEIEVAEMAFIRNDVGERERFVAELDRKLQTFLSSLPNLPMA
jgi:seryl-tRNA synthetase